MKNAIDIAYQKNNIIYSNINKLNASNKKAMGIDFKTTMARALESGREPQLTKTHVGHMDPKTGCASEVEPFEDEGKWNGYHWINIDREMRKLIENNLEYRTATEILLCKIAVMKEVIRGG